MLRRVGIGLCAWLALAIAVVVVACSTLLPGFALHYYLLLPGEAFPVAPAIKMPASQQRDVGELSYTIVYEQEADLPEALAAAAEPGVRVVSYEDVIGPSESPQESTELNQRLMSESQTIATVVALRKAGYDVRVQGRGVRVVEVLRGRPAAAVLEPGDVIVALDGEPIGTAIELLQTLRQHTPGETVEVTFRRNGAERTVSIKTVPLPGEPRRPSIGVAAETEGFDADLPFPVTIDSGDVLGPSAGLMFALGLYDAVTPGKLGGGVPVAGTGTIDLDGDIGPVDGVAQKVLGAEAAGAQVFLVPSDNADEAEEAASSIQVVAVDTFDEALEALRRLRG